MIGIDIISINRFKNLKSKDYKNWDKFFTQDEWQYAFKKANFSERLAGIFAAKEAVIKACASQGINNLSQVEIEHASKGEPIVKIKERAELKVYLSISHDKDKAIAVAISKYENN